MKKTKNNIKNNIKNNKNNDKLYNLYKLNKLNKKGGVLTLEKKQYYSDFMKMKADATYILHQHESSSLFLEMCQYLTREIYQTENPMFQYINDVLLPDVFEIIYDQQNQLIISNNYEKIKNFIKNTTFEYEESLKLFQKVSGYRKIGNLQILQPNEIEQYLSLFYKFYLKGGSAMKLIYNFYKEELMKYDPSNINSFLSPDEENMFLGKNSDYDFDFLINEMIPEAHYDALAKIASKTIYQLLNNVIVIYKDRIFNSENFIKKYIDMLKNNEPYSLNVINPFQNLLKNVSKCTIGDESEILENNPNINKIGYISCGQLDFVNPFEKKGKEAMRFYLIRLLLKLKNENKVDDRYTNIYAEIIDVGMPLYNSYDRKTKWDKTISNLKIKGIYCYNLNAIVNDLETVILETEQSNDPNKNAKLDKRRNRLSFFKNLICIVPRLLYDKNIAKMTGININEYQKTCEEIIDKICPSDLKITGKLKDELNTSLIGIYNNFPETINPNNLNIFSIIKQYFNYKLIININANMDIYSVIYDTPKLIEIKSNSLSNVNNIDEIYSSAYYTIVTMNNNANGVSYAYEQINMEIFIKICEIIDNLYILYKNVKDMKKLLCKLLLVYSKFIMYFNNYSLYNESVLQFIGLLMDISEKLMNGEISEISEQSLNISIINHRSLLQDILNRNKEINSQLIDILQYPLMKISLHIKDITGSKLYLRGSYAYNFHRLLRNNYQSEYLNFNDIDIYIQLNLNDYDEREDMNVWFENKTINICNIYNEYFKNIFEENRLLHDDEEIYSIVSYLFKSENDYLYQIILNRYLPCYTNDVMNVNFNHVFEKMGGNKNSYRIVNHHIFEARIAIQLNEEHYSNIEEILYDSHLLKNLNQNKAIIKNYFNLIQINNSLNNKLDANINLNPISLDNFYIQTVEGMSIDYNNIISEDTDILRKNIYIERLLSLSTNEI